MIGAPFPRLLRAELLKARSAPTLVSMFSLVVAPPLLLVFMTGALDSFDGGDAAATGAMLAAGATGAVGCAFFGSYLVTKDDYYRAMDRSFLSASPSAVVSVRVVAAAILGFFFALAGVVVWTIVVAVVLAVRGGDLVLDADAAAIVSGAVVAGTLAAVLGCGVGWLVRNYYVAVLVLLVLPPIVGVPMLSRVREVERFLPVGAVAGLSGAPIDGLLPPPLAGLVLLGWATLSVAAGWTAVRRRAEG
ncbi:MULTISPECIES: hypothetical protein [Bacteria]|uniref:hypothetical protein n=1 Tax=Bacteria TaxID=2 RepID=UPI003C7B8361